MPPLGWLHRKSDSQSWVYVQSWNLWKMHHLKLLESWKVIKNKLTCDPFSPSQGSWPNVNVSQSVTPNIHASLACENWRDFKLSGAHLLKRTYVLHSQGSYWQVCVKFKGFSRSSKRLSYCFQGLKTYVKSWFTHENSTSEMLKCITEDIVFFKTSIPLFGAAYAAPNKDTTILYWLRSPKTVLNTPVNKIQGLFKAFECFSSTFHAKVNF